MKKILIVDDNPDILELLSLIFDAEGYQILATPTGFQLLENVTKFYPDLILLDIMLGDYDGRDLCNELKNSALHKHIPILMLSASHGLYSLNEKHCHADGFMAKPFDVGRLIDKANSLVA
jgi:DNA-binding response OmpR family regulator